MAKASKVTIEDISRHTGLSRGTVSRALNDRPDISEQTKRRVLEACRTLKYVPSHAARSLATGRYYAVTALVDRLDTRFNVDFIRGVMNRAEAARYAVQVIELGGDGPELAERLRALALDRSDGVLISGSLGPSVVEQLKSVIGERAVTATAPLAELACDVLAPDLREAGRLAARFLAARGGGGQILFLHHGADGWEGAMLGGFDEELRARGLDAGAVAVAVEGRETLDSAVSSRGAELRAVAASTDGLAVSAMLALARLGRVVGEEVQVLGNGNAALGEALRPRLSTIDLAGEDIGRRSMETFLQRLNRERMDAAQVTYVAPQLIARDSTLAD